MTSASDSSTSAAAAIAHAAIASQARIAVAESLTSGTIASALGAAPDAGEWFTGAVVAYTEQAKVDIPGVAPGSIRVEELHLDGSPDDIIQATVDTVLRVLAADLHAMRTRLPNRDGGE